MTYDIQKKHENSKAYEKMYPLKQKKGDHTFPLQVLIYSYLLQNNYEKTAEVFANSCRLVDQSKIKSGNFPSYLTGRNSSSYIEYPALKKMRGIKETSGVETNESYLSREFGTEAIKQEGLPHGKTSDLSVNNISKEAEYGMQTDSSVREKQVKKPHDIFDTSTLGVFNMAEYQSYLLKARKAICESIHVGNIKEARRLAYLHFPEAFFNLNDIFGYKAKAENYVATKMQTLSTEELLALEPAFAHENSLKKVLLRYRIDTQVFIEMIREGDMDGALKFARNTLSAYKELLRMWNEIAVYCESMENIPLSLLAEIRYRFVSSISKNGHQHGAKFPPNHNGKGNSESGMGIGGSSVPRLDTTRMALCNGGFSNSFSHLNAPYFQGDASSSIDPSLVNTVAVCPINNSIHKNVVSRIDFKMALLDIENHLTELCSLLFYPRIKHIPAGSFLDLEYRAELSEIVNSAILEEMGFPKEPVLAKLIRQTHTVLKTYANLGSTKPGSKDINLVNFLDMNVQYPITEQQSAPPVQE